MAIRPFTRARPHKFTSSVEEYEQNNQGLSNAQTLRLTSPLGDPLGRQRRSERISQGARQPG